MISFLNLKKTLQPMASCTTQITVAIACGALAGTLLLALIIVSVFLVRQLNNSKRLHSRLQNYGPPNARDALTADSELRKVSSAHSIKPRRISNTRPETSVISVNSSNTTPSARTPITLLHMTQFDNFNPPVVDLPDPSPCLLT